MTDMKVMVSDLIIGSEHWFLYECCLCDRHCP